MQDDRKLRIAIVGGGVCGLTCALALAKEGLKAHVFEAAAQFDEIGAGVGFGPNAVRILQDIGIIDDVLASCDETDVNMRSFLYYSGMEGHEFIYDHPADPGDIGLGLHRAQFLNALVKNVDPLQAHNKKRCVKVIQSNSTQCPIIHFADGTTYEADVVLGADGIRSAVRSAVTGEDSQKSVIYSNTDCYRGLVPIEEIRAAGVVTDLVKRPVCFIGYDKHLILFPIKGGAVINVVAFSADRSVRIGKAKRPDYQPWVVPASRDQLLQDFGAFGSDVLKILGCIHSPNKWLIHVVHPPLPSYIKGRVALLGDAAHAMLPHLGAGAGQALEDAHLLAKLLSHPLTNIGNVNLVLEAYDHTRRPRAQMVWEGSLKTGEKYEGRSEHGYTVEGMREDLFELMMPVWRHELFADFEESLTYLREHGVFQ